jgi:hypothetical protein
VSRTSRHCASLPKGPPLGSNVADLDNAILALELSVGLGRLFGFRLGCGVAPWGCSAVACWLFAFGLGVACWRFAFRLLRWSSRFDRRGGRGRVLYCGSGCARSRSGVIADPFIIGCLWPPLVAFGNWARGQFWRITFSLSAGLLVMFLSVDAAGIRGTLLFLVPLAWLIAGKIESEGMTFAWVRRELVGAPYVVWGGMDINGQGQEQGDQDSSRGEGEPRHLRRLSTSDEMLRWSRGTNKRR